MELLIVLGVVCVAIAGARRLIVRQDRRERPRRRLEGL
jgi:hypothetical protein